MKTALLVVALGGNYRPYAKKMLESAKKYFIPHTPIVWTDDLGSSPPEAMEFYKQDLGFPQATLQRYRMFSEQAATLAEFDQLFYCDADMLFVAPVKESDICSEGITATLHPGFIVQRPGDVGDIIRTCGTPEFRERSTAYIPEGNAPHYFCGGFNGGNSRAFLKMAATLRENIDKDSANGLIALWHDESHLNCYLYHNPPERILTPSFCHPEDYRGQYGWKPEEYPPILLALDKRKVRR